MKSAKLLFAALLFALAPGHAAAQQAEGGRPAEPAFRSEGVEACIRQVSRQLTNPLLRSMFVQCFPNTLDTTVRYSRLPDGDDDTFVITGDINAMWLRDSGAQVWPYVRFAARDERLRHLIRGVVRRQLRCLVIDPYANAFTFSPDSMSSEWKKDYTRMLPGVFERKYELDSQCYPIRLAYAYWKATGDATVFDDLWLRAMRAVTRTMREQQRTDGTSPYKFMRVTHAMHDTQSNYGLGHPARPCGMVVSSFRPSDDATIFPFLIPSNFMARHYLGQAAEILTDVNHDATLAAECRALAADIDRGLRAHATATHPKYGTVYAFETDGYGSHLLMDDANVPSLLALPYIAGVPSTDPVYQNTRRFVLSRDNPYFFAGTAGEGIGGPHVGMGYVWPMSIILRAMTSDDDDEIRHCLTLLLTTHAGTGFMHEAFQKDDASKFTRSWFAWCNTLFGELILHLIDEGKLDLLNSLPVPPQS